MGEWREVRLGDICTLNYGKSLTSNNRKAGNIPVYSSAGITGWHNESLVNNKGIIVGRKGTVGTVYYSESPFYCIDTAYYVLPQDNKYDFKYLFYRLGSLGLKNLNEDSAVPGLNRETAYSQTFMLPPLPEQKAIAETLSCLDDKIELNNKINANLEQTAQAIFKSWFVDFEPFQDGEFVESELGRIPKGWRVVELGEIMKFIKGKKPNEFYEMKIDKNQAQYLTIDVLNGGQSQFAFKEKMAIADEYDILMVMDGASSGAIYFGLNGIIASTIAKVEVQNKQYREIVYQYLKINQSEVKTHNTGSAIPHADKGYILKCKIAIPPENELNKIADILLQIRKAMLNNSTQNLNLGSIRDTLLPKLMSGEIDVSKV